ncbi:MAG: potassium channel family protein [Bacilli bacterium]|nr:potassium channel family protein [Bacilli bacterium]
MKALGRVLIKTHASEFLVGLVIMILTASLILTFVEPKLENYGDALWYCFAIVTTIGFGDFSAVTLSGRLVSVFLGIYGIVVLALFTSIIVNLYNETKNETSKAKKIEEKKNEETPIEEEKEKPQEEEQLVEEKEK